jgi:hypothetical protein
MLLVISAREFDEDSANGALAISAASGEDSVLEKSLGDCG